MTKGTLVVPRLPEPDPWLVEWSEQVEAEAERDRRIGNIIMFVVFCLVMPIYAFLIIMILGLAMR